MNTPTAAAPPSLELKWPWVVAAGVGGVLGIFHLLGRGQTLPESGPQLVGQLGLYAAPLLLGILSGLFFRTRPVLKSLGLSLVCLLVVTPMMREGLLCLVFILPFHLVVSPLTAQLVVILRRTRRSAPRPDGVELLLLLVPFAAALWSRLNPPDPVAPVILVDSVVADAPPEAVWRSIDRLQLQFTQPAPWLVRAGLPQPLEIRGGGAFVGAERRVVFSNGTVLAKVTRADAPRSFEVALSVEESGTEFFDHWSVLGDSRFELEAMEGGRTRITHSTSYQPLSYPRWYFEPIERYLGRRVQHYMIDTYARQAFPSEVEVAGR